LLGRLPLDCRCLGCRSRTTGTVHPEHRCRGYHLPRSTSSLGFEDGFGCWRSYCFAHGL
jgi:hypothetical protein